MNVLLIILLSIVAFVIVFFVYRLIAFRKASIKTSKEQFERIRPLYDLLEGGQPLTEADVYDYAKNLLTRESAFQRTRQNSFISGSVLYH